MRTKEIRCRYENRGPWLRETVRNSGAWRIETVERPDTEKGFAVCTRRWIVERALPWTNQNRRWQRDFKNLAKAALAMIKLMLRR